MKYLQNLTLNEFSLLLNKMGYIFDIKDVDIEYHSRTKIKNMKEGKGYGFVFLENCMLVSCRKIPTKFEFEVTNKIMSNLPIFSYMSFSNSFSPFGRIIRISDYSAEKSVIDNDESNENITKALQEFLYKKYGEQYKIDLIECCKEEENTNTQEQTM